MKSTFERARRVIRAFNDSEKLTRVLREDFFAGAAKVICTVDGKRVSDVLFPEEGTAVMVFEVENASGKSLRLLGMWEGGGGQILGRRHLPPELLPLLRMEPDVQMFPLTMARQATEEATEAAPLQVVAGTDVPATGLGMLQPSDIPEGMDLANVVRSLLPDLQRRSEYLRHVEAEAIMLSDRMPAYKSASEAIALMVKREFPRDTLALLDLHLTPVLQEHYGMASLREAVERPQMVVRR